jgi:hypothetical protein
MMMDGNIVYQGLAKDSTLHFAKKGLQCPLRTNPADYFMRVLSVNYPISEQDKINVDSIVQHYNENIGANIMKEPDLQQLAAPDLSLYQNN